MDYEKAYKEALARAKDVHDYYCDDNEQIWKIESIFPELKEDAESEEERILASIADCVGLMGEDGNVFSNHNVTKAYVLTWLEKQKEQKPNIEICPHSTKSKSYKETGYPSVTRFVYKKSDEKFIRDCANILKANDYGLSAERLLSMLKQNPSWSEEERMMREFNDWLCEEIECRTNDLRDEKDRRTLNMLCYILTKVKDWPEKLKELMPPTHVDPCDASWDAYYQRGLNKGYELGKQEQKPAEWSEEDEKMLKNVLFVLESYVSQSESASSPSLITTYPTYFKEIVWLKSLRPSWKPSEEQMKALRNFSTGVFIGDGDCEALRSLYEDLKKL